MPLMSRRAIRAESAMAILRKAWPGCQYVRKANEAGTAAKESFALIRIVCITTCSGNMGPK